MSIMTLDFFGKENDYHKYLKKTREKNARTMVKLLFFFTLQVNTF